MENYWNDDMTSAKAMKAEQCQQGRLLVRLFEIKTTCLMRALTQSRQKRVKRVTAGVRGETWGNAFCSHC